MMPRSSSTTAEDPNSNNGVSYSAPSPGAMYGGGRNSSSSNNNNNNNSNNGNPSMNRNVHQSHSFGGGGDGSQGGGGGGGHHSHGGMGGPSNPNMDSFSTGGGRPSSRMTGLPSHGMGHNPPLTPGGGGGGMGGGYPGQSNPDAGSPVNASNMGQGMAYGGGGGSGGPMDGSMHPSMMGNSGMFDMRGGGGSVGNFAMSGSEMDSRSAMSSSARRSGRSSDRSSGGQERGSSSSGGGSSGRGGNVSQAEREEELLLNLLIARRQRGRNAGGEPSPALREELMRLRQQGGIDGPPPPPMGGGSGGGSSSSMGGGGGGGGGSSGGGGMPQMPGMPPMYDGPPGMMGNSTAPGAFPPGNTEDQRIDRPHYLMDARTQDMMGFRGGPSGGGGMGGGPGSSSAGMKRSAPSMGYDPGFAPNNQLKYPAYGMMAHPHAMGHPQDVHRVHGMGGPGMMGVGPGMPPPSKKRRSHKKKPADMPRRPLSAYNLFFSEERERILKEIDGKEGGEAKEGGGEGGDGDSNDDKKEGEEDEESKPEEKQEIDKPKALLRPLIPNQKKRRPHRKTHGKISFQQLARMVGERWKALPEDRRKYYQNLAQEDMKRQKEAMEEYYARQQAIKHGTAPVTEKPSADDDVDKGGGGGGDMDQLGGQEGMVGGGDRQDLV